MGKLTIKKIESKGPGLYGDGDTLYLRVRDSGSRSWVQIVTIDGKRAERGLGGYPVVTLQEARDTALDNRRALRRGENPFATPNPLAAAISNGVAVSNAPTFAEALEAVLDNHRPSWNNPRTEQSWRSLLRDYAMPVLGGKRVDAITAADVEAVLKPIWNARTDVAQRVKPKIHAVMAWAVAHGHRESNPVDAMKATLPKVKRKPERKHHKALPYAEVPAAIAAAREGKGAVVTKLAFEFLVLTAARSGEARGALWGEIDREAKTWTIPAGRMKAGAEHVVPLSNAAVEVLEAVAEELGEGDDGELIFPSPRDGKLMQDRGLTRLLADNGIDATVHGFRSSFRNWAAENGVERDIAEAALAHTLGGSVETSYKTTTYLEKRRAVMAKWAKHCLPA